jgi:SPP1 family holin
MDCKVKAGTIARTAVLLLAIVNQILSVAGYHMIPIDDEVINDLVTNVWIIVAALVSWWKNNSFTKAALAGDEAMKKLKEG